MSGFTGRAEAIDEAIVATYRRRSALSYSCLLRLIGWTLGAGEVWLTTRVLGKPLSLIDSFILESLISGVRGAAFMVPGALGAQEGGLVLFGALLGAARRTWRSRFLSPNAFASWRWACRALRLGNGWKGAASRSPKRTRRARPRKDVY